MKQKSVPSSAAPSLDKRIPPLRRDESLFWIYDNLYLDKAGTPKATATGKTARHFGKRSWLLPACGTALFCLLAGMVIVSVLGGGKATAPSPRLEALAGREPGAEPDPRALALRFLRADTAEAKALLTRDPARDRERVFRSFADGQAPVGKCVAVRDLGLFRDGGVAFHGYAAVLENGNPHLVAVVKRSDGTLGVDWDCFVCANDPGWEALAAPENAGRDFPFRVLVERADYYNRAYSDEKTWACYRLTTPEASGDVHGYCRRDSPAHRDLEAALGDSRERTRLMLRLRVGDYFAASKQGEITGFLRREWVVP